MMASLGKLKRSEKSTHRKTHKTGNRGFQKMSWNPRFHSTLTCFCRGKRRKHARKKKVASTGDRTDNYQVMSPIRSPLSHPGGAEMNVYDGSVRDKPNKASKMNSVFSQFVQKNGTL